MQDNNQSNQADKPKDPFWKSFRKEPLNWIAFGFATFFFIILPPIQLIHDKAFNDNTGVVTLIGTTITWVVCMGALFGISYYQWRKKK